jgi:hypothetical protein
MVKVMFGWRDRPGMTPEECEQNYRTGHMEIAKKCFTGVDGFQALVYNRVRSGSVNDFNKPEPRAVKPDFDAIVEIYFRDPESMGIAFERPELKAMFLDHPNFMDTECEANVRVYAVDEDVFFGTRP